MKSDYATDCHHHERIEDLKDRQSCPAELTQPHGSDRISFVNVAVASLKEKACA
jgi:hypothetical protein